MFPESVSCAPLSIETKREHALVEGFCRKQRPAREGWGRRKREGGEGVRLRREGESEHALTAFCSHNSLDPPLHLSHVRPRKYQARRAPRRPGPSTPSQMFRRRRRTHPSTTPFDPKPTHRSPYPWYQPLRPWSHSGTRSRRFTWLWRNRLARWGGELLIKLKNSRKILSLRRSL